VSDYGHSRALYDVVKTAAVFRNGFVMVA